MTERRAKWVALAALLLGVVVAHHLLHVSHEHAVSDLIGFPLLVVGTALIAVVGAVVTSSVMLLFLALTRRFMKWVRS